MTIDCVETAVQPVMKEEMIGTAMCTCFAY